MNAKAMEQEHGCSADYREGLAECCRRAANESGGLLPLVSTEELLEGCSCSDSGMPVQMLGEEPAANDTEEAEYPHARWQQLMRSLHTLRVKRTHERAQLPTYGTEGAACFDLAAVGLGMHTTTVMPGQARTFRTGLAFVIPEGWAMLIFSRSGHGFKQDVRLANCVGVIDSDYRGEVHVRLTADRHGQGIGVREGDRIAQAMLVRAGRWYFAEVDELPQTARGAGGFGSTGA